MTEGNPGQLRELANVLHREGCRDIHRGMAVCRKAVESGKDIAIVVETVRRNMPDLFGRKKYGSHEGRLQY